MNLNRRQALGTLAGTALAGLAARYPHAFAQTAPATAPAEPPPIPDGPFKGTRESLSTYKVPDWYRDAKFGMWAHWGPQSAAEYGDWYARKMYIQNDAVYNYHVKTYGHPTKAGFKDVIPTWKAEKFDADALITLYKKAGAKYFCSMACHHDGFDLWNSKFQPKWNAVASGPKKDIVTLFRDAARKQGLRFAVSEHLSNSFSWFATSHLSDKTGPQAGVAYDGQDPAFADLYHDYSKMAPDFAATIATGNGMNRAENVAWKLNYYQRIMDLIDQHEPDLLYTDGGIPYGNWGLNLVAHHYNKSAAKNNGVCQAIYNSKTQAEATAGMCVLDKERGVATEISAAPWQTDTCIGGWHYDKRVFDRGSYKTPKVVIDMLVDIVARNGNLMLNIPLPNNGMPDDKELKVIEGITAWMAVNSEGIYATRPYKIAGEGPGMNVPTPPPGTRFNENNRKPLVPTDIRFTTKGDTLFAFMMGWPDAKTALITSLATNAKQGVGKIQNVELLGVGKVPFTQDDTALKITLPEKAPSENAVVFKINGA